MVSVLASNAVDRGFEPRLGQTKDYKIVIYFSAKRAALRTKSKDWLARNQDSVLEWGEMSIRELLFQWGSTIKIQLSEYKVDLIIILLKITLFSPWYSWKFGELALATTNHFFFFRPLYFPSFFELRLLVGPLGSSNISWQIWIWLFLEEVIME